MEKMKENDLLRLSMILENQSATTRDRYICKFVEYAIYDADKTELSIVEICTAIEDEFQLEFDFMELEKAIELKSNGRILESHGSYRLSAKAADQLSNQNSVSDQLKEYVHIFSEEKGCDENELYALILKHIYYSFNSNVKNFSLIIGSKAKMSFSTVESGFQYSQDEADIINGFMLWPNMEKNKLIFTIITSSYEYCLITSNKNPTISKTIFRNKCFFLDTNILFRIAGLNNNERQFVTKTFVDKCREVGIKLCYTSAVFNELYRVIDAQIKYIRDVTKDQYPIDAKMLAKLSNEYEINDFYQIYYNWCKEPQNNYKDYLSFRTYLISKINTVIREFEYRDSSMISLQSKRNEKLCESLLAYKNEKRKYGFTTEESVKTDVTQIAYLETVRPKTAKSLWDMNEFIVSADQLLVSWADSQFDGVPMVVIPSVWLSIILRITGRATEDDYQSFCTFMTLRHYRTEDDNTGINPTEILSRLADKTIDIRIKEAIVSEIITNKSEYSFDTSDDYDTSIEKAFDVVLKSKNDLYKEELKKAVDEERQKAQNAARQYESELTNKKSAEEYAQEYARLKAQKMINCFARRGFVPLIIKGLSFIILFLIVLCFIAKIQPFYNLLSWIVTSKDINNRIWSIITWIINIVFVTLPTYFGKIWDYLSSEQRKNRLCAKYFNQQLKVLNDKSLGL